MSDNQRFTLTAKPREPVQAGAIVRLEARLDDSPPGELDKYYRITWHVVGPFSDDEEIVEGTSRFDLNTAGRTPGAYTVRAVRTPLAGTQPAEARTPAQGQDPSPPPGRGMPVAVRAGTPRFEQLARRVRRVRRTVR